MPALVRTAKSIHAHAVAREECVKGQNAPAYAELISDQQLEHVFRDLGMILGQSRAMREVANQIYKVALSPDSAVLLQGETGTGKEVAARVIHELSRRAAYPLVAINCTALPETLLETELFGVEAGAYTDAKAAREGYILRADGGSLLLDEVGSMPLSLQSKLLRFLESLRFRRVGGTKELKVNLRIISATNIDLRVATERNAFRSDLFYRLNVMPIYIPPLRERLEDIEPLVEYFLQKANHALERSLRIAPEAIELMLRYSWPGNIRELCSAIQSAQVLCENQEIGPQHLRPEIRTATSVAAQNLQDILQEIHLSPEGVDLPAFLSHIERTFVQEALEYCHGNQVHAAALLHITRDQLRYRLSAGKLSEGDHEDAPL